MLKINVNKNRQDIFLKKIKNKIYYIYNNYLLIEYEHSDN